MIEQKFKFLVKNILKFILFYHGDDNFYEDILTTKI